MHKFPSLQNICFPHASRELATQVQALANERTWRSSKKLAKLVDDTLETQLPQSHLREALSPLVLKDVIELELSSLSLLGIIQVSGGRSSNERAQNGRAFAGELFEVTEKNTANTTAIFVHENSPKRGDSSSLSWQKIDVLTAVGEQAGSRQVKRLDLECPFQHGMMRYSVDDTQLDITVLDTSCKPLGLGVFSLREEARQSIEWLLETHGRQHCTIRTHGRLAAEQVPRLSSSIKSMTFEGMRPFTTDIIRQSGAVWLDHFIFNLSTLERLTLLNCALRRGELTALQHLLPDVNIRQEETLS